MHAVLTHLLLNDGNDAENSLCLGRAFTFATEEMGSATPLVSLFDVMGGGYCSTEF